MKRNLIAMTSITYSMKAKEILNSMGIYCEIERTPKNLGSGCGYSIRVKSDTDEIVRILENNNIPYKAVLIREDNRNEKKND